MLDYSELTTNERLSLCNESLTLHNDYGLGGDKISQRFYEQYGIRINRGTIKGWYREGKIPNGRNWVNEPDLTPSPELSYVMGCWYTDATRGGKPGGDLALRVKDLEYVKEYNKCFCEVVRRQEEYPIHTNIDDLYCVYASSTELKNYAKKTLDEHKELIEAYPAEFLRAAYDGDGSPFLLRHRYTYGYVRFANTNRELVAYIKSLLNGLAIKTGNINSYSKGRKKTIYDIVIGGRRSLINLHNKIGFTIKRKQTILEDIVKSIGDSRRKHKATGISVSQTKDKSAYNKAYRKMEVSE